MSIEVRNLTRIYGEQKAVNDISFSVGKGEIVGFLGPNGAGKSTTMKIITGYLAMSSGEAFVSGISVREDPLSVKKKIGYLPELNALYYEMYVLEYLSFISDIHRIPRARNRIREVLQLTGLLPESKKKIGQLSKGYKQRVGLAAALIHDPEVLILDEPTSGLDPNQIIEIREVIRQQGKNKTVLFSSHILQEVEAICDRVIIIHKGQLVADDQISKMRQSAGDQSVVTVSFSGKVEESDLVFPVVTRVERSGPDSFRLFTTDAESLRRMLLEMALAKNLSISSLQTESRSLETIFKQLTGGRVDN